MTETSRAAYVQHVRRVKPDMPGLPKMCEQADHHWLSRYPAGLADERSMSFVDQYTYIYDYYSWMAHPNLTGLQAFWDAGSQWTVIHASETGNRPHDPLHMGQLLAAHGLLIAAMTTGTPRVVDVIELLNSNAELAALVRDGSVVTEEVAPGRFELRLRTFDTTDTDTGAADTG